MKGCPLSCWWCHNPEGIDQEISLISDPKACIDCFACVEACPHNALAKGGDAILRDDVRCETCCTCVDTCPALSHQTTGWIASVDTIMEEVLKDKPFYEQTGGGVTVSGGEPLLQADFLLAVLEACGKENIHRTLDTSAYASQETLTRLSPHIDLWLVDLKHMDSEIHKRNTGIGNELILKNIQSLSEQGANMRLRIPLIPGVNDSGIALTAMAQFISSLKVQPPIDILPYHDTARGKYEKLQLSYASPGVESLGRMDTTMAQKIFLGYGISTHIGG